MINATTLLYPVLLVLLFTLTLIFIPRRDYNKYLFYGFLVGGLGDIISVALFQNILHVMWFKNQGIFYVLGQNALSPPAWTLTVMLFLFFLPRWPSFLYLYIATWAFASLGFGYIVRNAKLFDFLSWFYPIPAYFIFLTWWSFAALLFLKTSPLARTRRN